MLTVSLAEPGRFEALEAPDPAPGPGEALVRVHRLGVCGTDLHAFTGRQPFFSYPRILGHELGVEVVEAGEGVDLPTGCRCCVAPVMACGRCIACRRGRTNACENIAVLGVHADGGMRERFVVPAANLHPSASLSFDQLALIETLTIGCHAVDRGGVEAGETALVVGAGPIGLTAIQFLLARGADVIVMDLSDERLAFCRDVLGVARTLNPAGRDAAAALREINGGDLPTALFDATGHAGSMAAGFELVAHGGRIVFIGFFRGDLTFDDTNFHKRELTLFASRNSTPEAFRRTIAMVEAGEIDTAPWITHRLPLSGVVDRFGGLAKQPGLIKAMIEVA
ncbi:zinc-binding alcohol dehydrogenase family protein [Phycisphaera mikurensis]|uniref:Putative zinc-containing alcohol dehydrogenase n=1 Tax=Phycisphaera mikurensis (strain NBRC 102666 / KCTC 22515 / FYK2301M01) TaxID=1142394 RepID=I0IEV3_PHYMF|nr:zinc-binding alcohol dehydrogenase family protein [Phycisphaera mikurensis]MBB6441586.1 2-desacetyl-2-hydroxyethyl bacteriochlorophyllide A dehydrogenase [Phycisphaera mikurensis]BAM03791.1 putative zinc-containing alcohol dehydrogenase [Phycisphaera mikurensis NBRC 102666]